MMSEEKARKVLDNLVRDIAVSTKRSEALSQLTNKELAEKLISDVWGISKLFGEKSDLLTEAIERLFVLDTPERVYCTADGEWPTSKDFMLIELVPQFDEPDYTQPLVAYLDDEQKDKAGHGWWLDENDNILFFHHKVQPNVYWKPLTSLKDEYERQHESEGE